MSLLDMPVHLFLSRPVDEEVDRRMDGYDVLDGSKHDIVGLTDDHFAGNGRYFLLNALAHRRSAIPAGSDMLVPQKMPSSQNNVAGHFRQQVGTPFR